VAAVTDPSGNRTEDDDGVADLLDLPLLDDAAGRLLLHLEEFFPTSSGS